MKRNTVALVARADKSRTRIAQYLRDGGYDVFETADLANGSQFVGVVLIDDAGASNSTMARVHHQREARSVEGAIDGAQRRLARAACARIRLGDRGCVTRNAADLAKRLNQPGSIKQLDEHCASAPNRPPRSFARVTSFEQ